jgi:hypothetical protein
MIGEVLELFFVLLLVFLFAAFILAIFGLAILNSLK